ncbi:type IV pilus modification protein PilV [Pseudomonas gingeri]|uniref:Type IV pilus modification protein PilV n=2 Tax=Pseudomonas gingeri TaxID=117681 RepID=A0A7Y7XDY1_9PSED|nr:type IV pilus modification protein PilV [Pseudomonas gingeri]NWB97810.1 type IV pilus modification protein PilV [Pseudomonas gingeri]
MPMKCHQQVGVTLIEVLVAMLVLAVGLLGAAALQLNALRYTDSSTMSTQASFIAYDLLDRIRANPCSNASSSPCSNPGGDYALAALSAAPTTISTVRDQDLSDFANNVKNFGGSSPSGSVSIAGGVVTIAITWDDSRAANAANTAASNSSAGTASVTFTLVSQIATVWTGT